jgi:glycosyltransferase involved in cell wall biosynthesis
MTTVLHLSSSSGPGGAEAVVASLASGLDPASYRSVVCLFRDGWLRDRCERLGLETHVVPMRGMLDLGWLRRFTRLLRDRGVDVIHAHEFGANTYGALAGRLAGVPAVATVHGRSYYADCRRRRLAYRVVSRAAAMVAVSEDVKRFVVETTGVAAARVRVVLNGVAAAAPVSEEVRASLRADLGLRDGERVVTVVGSLYPVKGHRHLLQAVPQVLESSPSTVVLIAGRGSCERELREQAKRLGIEAQVRFLGLRGDVPVLLATSDVFVLPSLSEGLSIAILEAMAAGRPVVTTRVGGNPELVLHGQTGILVPPADAPALASAVIALLTNPAAARRLGENGQRHVTERFGIEAMVRQYEAIYNAALKGTRDTRDSSRMPTAREGPPDRSREPAEKRRPGKR